MDWIKEGSKIVITTSDKSLLQNLVNYTFVVPKLNDKDGLKYFTYHAFSPNNPPPEENYLRLSRKNLDYAEGNPLFLKELGVELLGKEEEDWQKRVGTLTKSSNPKIQDALSKRYLELSEKQKDAFLDIACFFRSKTTSYVRCMLDSCDSGVIGNLTDRFLISISGGRVEMHDVLYTFGKELASRVQCRLWNHKKIVRMLKYKSAMENVRGVFLDMSEVKEKMSFDTNSFTSMRSLRYLKIYSSICAMECKADQIIDVAEGLQFTLAEVRCLDWLRFSLDKLPSDFNPRNLVNLSLPYSSIKQAWEGVKDTPNLKWVDLNHSLNLSDLSGLSNAQNLERLNPEGCTKLVKLPEKMGNMKSLVFLNMRGCTSLRNLPKANLSSLKVLILSDCSRFQEFQVISENLETLYLDGTALERLPPAIGSLQRLVLLNLRGCKALEHLPSSLGKLRALEDLILSGCSKLKSFPTDTGNMKHLRILLVDGTALEEIQMILHFKESLQRLCLSGNSMINLPANIKQLNHLKWLDLKYCENLIELPTLPPNLEYLDAHGCHKLEHVMDPLVVALITEQLCSTFIFTNCTNLEEDARNTITSYAERKCQLHAFKCYDMGFVSRASFKTCFPGCEVPLWFQHQAVGSVLEKRLQPSSLSVRNLLQELS